MENASKALLMAGGVLITMLVVSLIVYAWNVFSNYYQYKEDLTKIDDVSEFNLQFTNYDRDDVMGYEVLSLANRVADYNFRFSNSDDAKNDEKYQPIVLTINMNNHNQVLSKKVKGTRTENLLFKLQTYTQSAKSDQIQEQIVQEAQNIENYFGSADSATKIAKALDSIILSDDQYQYNRENRNMTDNQSEILAVSTYNSLVKSGNKFSEDQYDEMVNAIEKRVYAYYEYYQFKNGIFKCKNIEYESNYGRVSKITFDFTGNIK